MNLMIFISINILKKIDQEIKNYKKTIPAG